jgi:hypothetical protein
MTKKLGKSECGACGGGWESFRKKSVMNLEMCVESVADVARFTYSYEREPACNKKNSSPGSSIIGWFHCTCRSLHSFLQNTDNVSHTRCTCALPSYIAQ